MQPQLVGFTGIGLHRARLFCSGVISVRLAVAYLSWKNISLHEARLFARGSFVAYLPQENIGSHCASRVLSHCTFQCSVLMQRFRNEICCS